jgi:hypothetical protein
VDAQVFTTYSTSWLFIIWRIMHCKQILKVISAAQVRSELEAQLFVTATTVV